MSDHEAHDDYLARIATDIMYSDKYIDLLGSIYSERDSIAEFEINPKHYLMRHGIHIPDDIDVVLHYPGALGQLGRVDFHWGEPVRTALSNMRAAREKFRELARMASETLHSREMKQLRQTVQASPEALKEFASNPKGYAKAHGVVIPDELELKVELDDGDEPPELTFISTPLRASPCCEHTGSFHKMDAAIARMVAAITGQTRGLYNHGCA